MLKYNTGFKAVILLVILSVLFLASRVSVFAQSSSTNYRVEESFFGTGGELDASSTNYKAKQSAGETTVGNASSTNFQTQAGFNTTYHPYLEFQVNTTSINLGILSAGTAATGTATFNVRNYLTSGYTVMVVGPVPTNEGGATINAMSTRGASVTNTEQFGLNLRANTSPTTFGADVVQVPDSSFSFGAPTSEYNVVNQYKYINGDSIASSASSSGQTNYTAAYLVNIAPLTDSGLYSTDQVFVATGTY